MNVSDAQVSRTASYEGFASKAYKDGFVGGVQMFSIGYGHQIQSGEQNLRSATITKGQGLAMLKSDMQTVVNYINAKSKKTLNQNQFDALCDFGYNCGVGALQLVLTDLNDNGYGNIPGHLYQYTKTHSNVTGELVVSPTLVARRAAEVALFLAPTNLFIPALIAATIICAIIIL